MPTAAPTTKNYLAKIINSTKVEKPCAPPSLLVSRNSGELSMVALEVRLTLLLLSSFHWIFSSVQPMASCLVWKLEGRLFFPNLLFKICCGFLIFKNLASGCQKPFQNYYLQHGFQRPILKLISHGFVSLFSEFCFGTFFPRVVSILSSCLNLLRARIESRVTD